MDVSSTDPHSNMCRNDTQLTDVSSSDPNNNMYRNSTQLMDVSSTDPKSNMYRNSTQLTDASSTDPDSKVSSTGYNRVPTGRVRIHAAVANPHSKIRSTGYSRVHTSRGHKVQTADISTARRLVSLPATLLWTLVDQIYLPVLAAETSPETALPSNSNGGKGGGVSIQFSSRV